jgi:hypothetical protein
MIILTEAQATQVRGSTSHGAALAPVFLTSGEYALPEEVLQDMEHSEHHALLSSLPVRSVTTEEFAGYSEEG